MGEGWAATVRRRPPNPDDDYQDWEFPDPDEIEELSNLPEPEGPATIAGIPVSFLLKAIAFFIIVGLIGSLALPVIEPLRGVRQPEAQTIPANPDIADYHLWLDDSVLRALDDSSNTARARYLGVRFGESGRDPIIGVLAEGYDPTSAFPSAILHNPSIEVLRRIFNDDRAERVTLAWLWDPPGEAGQEIVMLVGMLRSTAESIDWSYMRASDLPRLADEYQEAHPASRSTPVPA